MISCKMQLLSHCFLVAWHHISCPTPGLLFSSDVNKKHFRDTSIPSSLGFKGIDSPSFSRKVAFCSYSAFSSADTVEVKCYIGIVVETISLNVY